ncbi:MAG: fimbrillin family protein [Prevotella sp.]|nr:fimbrillin family protein [Prevotella sp.]
MKKTVFIAALAIAALASCSKQVFNEGVQSEVVFQVARYKGVTKAITPPSDTTDYKENYKNVPFGVYAWFKGETPGDDTDFMVNQKVSYTGDSDNRWAPEGTTYYWPKSGSIDFIGYSPYATAGSTDAPFPTITDTTIAYPAWNVADHQDVDIMYADKVTGLKNNTNAYYYNGVPMLFHHALAKVNFQIKAAYTEVEDTVTHTKTKWDIEVESIKVNNILSSGSFTLSLNGTSWDKPTDANGNNVWNPDGTTTDLNLDLTNLDSPIQKDSLYTLDSNVFVMPQTLTGGNQEVVIKVTITTYRDTGSGYEEVLKETGVEIQGNLSGGTMDAWEMNQNVTYSFNFAPSLGTTTTEDTDGDGIPDVVPTIVYFDPAVDEWENITVSAGINI